MWVQSLGLKDPLEKGMKTHSVILAWRIPWTEEPGGLKSMGRKKSDTTEHACTHTHTHTHIQETSKGLCPLTCLAVIRINHLF